MLQVALDRQAHGEGPARTRFPADGDAAAVPLNYSLDDGEPEPRPLLAFAAARARAGEGLEQPFQLLGRNARPLVLNVEQHCPGALFALKSHLDRASARRELDGVAHKVVQDLLHLRRVETKSWDVFGGFE